MDAAPIIPDDLSNYSEADDKRALGRLNDDLQNLEQGAVIRAPNTFGAQDPAIVVCVEGGCVTAVYVGGSEISYDLVDWDNAKGGDRIEISPEGYASLPQELRDEIDEHNADDGARSDDEGDNMTDAEADADTLKSAGMGTDEDYGGDCYGDDYR